jgi:histone-lysine N-methyltransferase SETMAR
MSWVAEGETARTVVKRNQFEPKSMFTIFFRSTGVVFVDCLESGKTICARYYRDKCLKPVFQKVTEQRVISGVKNMKILHDNAKPHVAKIVKTYIENEGIITIDHPPYSPDLAPCDFWLFSKIKRELSSHPDVESLKSEITEVLQKIPKEEYLKTFKKYLERMQLCITNEGEYFEHLIK